MWVDTISEDPYKGLGRFFTKSTLQYQTQKKSGWRYCSYSEDPKCAPY